MSSLRFSAYTYARVAVMKSRLLRKENYDRMLKMGFNEILKHIEESEYKKEMDENDVSSQDINIIESALNANLIRTIEKLHRISNESMKEVLKLHALRYDIANMKTIIRSKFAGVSHEEIKELLYESINYSKEFFIMLSKKERVVDIINTFSSLRKMKLDVNSLFELESGLDKYYWKRMCTFAESIKGSSVADFIYEELEMINIKTILRLQGEMSQEEIRKYLVKPSKKVLRLLSSDSKNKKEIIGTDDEEVELKKTLLRKSSLLSHKNVLSVNYILGYLISKKSEISNLKALIKAKKFKMDPEVIEKMLVVAI